MILNLIKLMKLKAWKLYVLLHFIIMLKMVELKISLEKNYLWLEKRPFKPEDRSEFGHWEGDTIVGSNNIKNSGAGFTSVERKTRFQITIKCENKKALTIYKTVKKIKKNTLN